MFSFKCQQCGTSIFTHYIPGQEVVCRSCSHKQTVPLDAELSPSPSASKKQVYPATLLPLIAVWLLSIIGIFGLILGVVVLCANENPYPLMAGAITLGIGQLLRVQSHLLALQRKADRA